MQISKKEINQNLESKIKNIFAQLIADINTKEQAQDFLQDFLTETEYVALVKRMGLIFYLSDGKSYKTIKDDLKVSSATIATVQSGLEKQKKGLILALKLIKAEEWASKWAGKITGIFGKK
ncbi:hypothetical protein GYA19_02320 [Candidatus Beckwithbacteria bacterium]|nr:hypothetical protein [Candidatus Beckwithbacteria bacterium]